jgi:hypothetical protein
LECGRWAKTGRGKYFWDSGKSNRCEGEVEGMRRDCQWSIAILEWKKRENQQKWTRKSSSENGRQVKTEGAK